MHKLTNQNFLIKKLKNTKRNIMKVMRDFNIPLQTDNTKLTKIRSGELR